MSQPPYPYNRIFDFESFSINTPSAQQPGVQLEGEYDAIKLTIDSLISRLAEIQRADGKLKGEAFDITTASAVYLEILSLLQPTLALKANLASPALTGTPTAPTPATNSNNTNIATTAFVKAQGYATTTLLSFEIDGVELLIDAVDERVDATNEEVSHKLDKRTGGTVLEDVTLNKKLNVYGYSPEIIVQSTNSTGGIANLTNSFIQFLNGYGTGYSLINSGLLAVSQSTIGFAQLEPNKISVSNQFGANKVELSSAGLKFLDGTLQSTAFTPADYATNTSVDTKIANLVNSAPGTLNTLGEIATALGNDANLATTLTNSIATKLPLTGGTLTGQLQVASAGLKNSLNENFIIDAYNDDGAGTHNLFKFNPYGGALELPVNSAGLIVDPVGRQGVSKGSFDSGRGGYNGISLVCANHYELNWQSGYLKNVYNNSVAPINIEDSNLNFVSNGTTPNGITFKDLSFQTTAALPLAGGGTVSGNVTISLGSVENELQTFVVKNYNDNPYFYVSPYEYYSQLGNVTFDGDEITIKDPNNLNVTMLTLGKFSSSPNIYGIRYNDNSIQTTAFIPADYAAKTGATFTGKVNVNTGTGNVPLNIGITGTPTAYTPGDVWISGLDMRFRDSAGTTKVAASLSNSNAFSTYQSITGSNSTIAALTVTQTGTGPAFVVNDESPDSSPFTISNTGRVGVGIAPDATVALTVDSTGIKINGMVIIPGSTVTNSVFNSNGQMSHAEYPKELLIVLNGVSYGIPLRVV